MPDLTHAIREAEKAVRIARRRVRRASPGRRQLAALRLKDAVTAALKAAGQGAR
jgi:hypothetical protein